MALFVSSALLRVALVAAACVYHGESLHEFLERGDAASFLAVREILSGNVEATGSWVERVFLGWPLLLLLGPSGPHSYAFATGAGILLASLVPPLYFLATGSRAGAWALVALPPTWLMHSVLAMSEPLQLALCLAAIWTALRDRPGLAGALLGLAMLVRPPAVFLALAVLAVNARRWGARGTITCAGLAILGPIIQLVLNLVHYGTWDHQAQLYGSTPNISASAAESLASLQPERVYFNIPFMSLITVPLVLDPPAWKVVFIFAHVFVVCLGTLFLLHRRADGPLASTFAGWAALNTVFIVSGGPYWGFHSFDRYAVWALPAYLYSVTLALQHVPRICRPWLLWSLSGLSMAVTAWALAR